MEGRREFLIIGFTGPIGAGCTTAAKFFSNFENFDRFVKALISEENFSETNKQIYDLYKRMMLEYENKKKEDYKKELEKRLKEREFLKVLKYYYDETPYKFKIKYISFSKALIQELVERILLGDLEQEIKNFPNNELYLTIVSKIKDQAEQLLSIVNKESIKNFWKAIIARRFREIKQNKDHWFKFKKYLNAIDSLSEQIKKIIKEEINGSSRYISFLQDMGTMVRLKGSILYRFSEEEKFSYPHPVYALSYRINLIIKFFRHFDPDKYNRFVIEAFRNPFEIEFFRQRYYEFYLISLFAPFHIRQKRHPHIENLEERDKIDQGLDIDSLNENKKNELYEKFAPFIEANNTEEALQILKIAMQDTQKCVELSDININNQTDCKEELYKKLLFYFSLVLQPGFVPPSTDETLMNMAYMLSLQSTCISRQVGAIITEENGYIVGAGWNDVSEGQIGCGLRWRKDCEMLDNEILPIHPLSEERFREKIIKVNGRDRLEESFCFKDEYAKFKDKSKSLQHCRALHAEENAILQTAKIGGIGLKNAATIYTTTFPCELCAKKIYQVGIDRVVYVEPYPKSISEEVFFKDGIRQPKIEQFEGVKPYSYFRLYKPLFNKKDWQKFLKNNKIKKFLLS